MYRPMGTPYWKLRDDEWLHPHTDDEEIRRAMLDGSAPPIDSTAGRPVETLWDYDAEAMAFNMKRHHENERRSRAGS